MSRLIRLENLDPANAYIFAEPEAQHFKMGPRDILDLELFGGNIPVALFLTEDSFGNREISIWPKKGGYRLWKAQELLWESGAETEGDGWLDLALRNRTPKGVFLISTGVQPAHCLTAGTEGTVRFATEDTDFSMAFSRTNEGDPAMLFGSRLKAFGLVGARSVP